MTKDCTSAHALASLAIAIVACSSIACSSEVVGDSDANLGPCEPMGSWTLSYVAHDQTGPPYPSPIGDQVLTLTETAQGVEAVLDSSAAESASVSGDGCELELTQNSYWEDGAEPWKDERDWDLHVAGDQLSGELTYGCNWCPEMGETYGYAVSGARAP